VKQRVTSFHKFNSFKEGEEWDHNYYRNLSHEERMEILFALLDLWKPNVDELPAGHPRVCRITKGLM